MTSIANLEDFINKNDNENNQATVTDLDDLDNVDDVEEEAREIVTVEDLLEEEEEKKEMDPIIKSFNEMPMDVFAEVFARAHLKEQYPEEETVRKNEHYTKTFKLDLKNSENDMDKIFYQRLCYMLRNVHLKEPDEMFFSLYARKAGGSIARKADPDMTICSAICLRDFIQVKDHAEDIVLRAGFV